MWALAAAPARASKLTLFFLSLSDYLLRHLYVVQSTVFSKLCLDFYFFLVHWRAITSPYFVIAPQHYIALCYRDINLLKSFYHVHSIPKDSL